ncbi:MAG: YegP family protein [Nitrospira sp.]
MQYRIYKDAAGYWRWRLLAANNRIIADSGESYIHKAHCQDAINLVKNSSYAPIYEV